MGLTVFIIFACLFIIAVDKILDLPNLDSMLFEVDVVLIDQSLQEVGTCLFMGSFALEVRPYLRHDIMIKEMGVRTMAQVVA